MKAQKLIAAGQNTRSVWKSCRNGVHTDVFETICAFLNSGGGTLLLGVEENGNVTGLSVRAISEIIKGLKKAAANTDIFRPSFYLFPEEEILSGRHVLVLEVPDSPEVHALRGQVFVRRGSRNVRLEHREELARLYTKKQTVYTERKIYPFLKETDLQEALLTKVRTRMQQEEHPWGSLEGRRLLEAMNLAGVDYETGERGLRFLAALLLGKDSTIRNIFGNTEIFCEKQEDERIWKIHLETNLLDEIENVQEFLADVLDEEDRNEFLYAFFTEREYSAALPAKISVSEREVTAEFAGGMGKYGNPLLGKILRTLGMAWEKRSGRLQMEQEDGICTMRMEKSPQKTVKEPLEAEETLSEMEKAEEKLPKLQQTEEKLQELEEKPDETVETVERPQETKTISQKKQVVVQQTLPFMTNVYTNYEEKLTPEERQREILKMMEENDRVSVGTMVRNLQVTKRTVLRDIEKLKKQNLVSREGSEKSGRWILS